MRKNIRLVLQAFSEGKAKSGDTCHTDGIALYSYSMKIAEYEGRDRTQSVLVIDIVTTRTTASHIRACLDWFAPASVKRVEGF